ncbi:SHOCT domain-containing protein [Candidatus Parcubacteria bacterium]|nr:SHOCT domain-containing protein [Candidatus Parcubacteria bacterium]
MYGYGRPEHFLGGILELVFWVLIVVIILKLLRRRKMGGWGRWGGSSAMNLLEERYVKGEIGKEEFEQKKKDLMS